LSVDDFTVLPLLSVGGHGVISVVSNIVPRKMSQLCKAFFENDVKTAQKLHYEISPLSRAMFLETNPIPVKTALSLMGKMKLELRLPLVPMLSGNEEKLRNILGNKQLISG
jgi:4-hydroxy-tetrahydrodipicolinate synthase